MCSVTTPRIEVIDGCRTSPNRSVRWAPASDPADPASGTLEVCDGYGGPRATPRVRCYKVVELVPGRGFAASDERCFICVKPGGVTYECVVGRKSHSCTCAAGSFGKVEACCHILGLRALLENNWLGHPQARPDIDQPLELDATCPREACGGRLYEDPDGYCRCDHCGYAS